MNKGIVLGIVILVIGMSFTGTTYSLSISESQKFSFDGNILYVGGNGSGNYTKIQDAINDASDGDTVFVFDDSSPYFENLVVDTSINLIGENKDTTVIDDNGGISIREDRVNISGFTIFHGCIKTKDKFNNIIISDNHFIGCSIGINLFNSDDSYVISNSFNYCEYAIWCESGDNITISNNIIIYNKTELSHEFGDIDCMGGSNLVITNNTCINLREGAYKTGLRLGGVADSIIEDNEFNGYDWIGINLRDGNYNNLISHNNIINNDLGIGIYFFSGSNRIINNNFVNNKGNAYSSFPYFNKNIFDGNYWDDWIGLKYPILDFLPYFEFSFLGSVIDWHPAKEPYIIGG